MYRPIIFVIIVLCVLAHLCPAQPKVLFDFADDFDIASVAASDAQVSLAKGALCIKAGIEKTELLIKDLKYTLDKLYSPGDYIFPKGRFS